MKKVIVLTLAILVGLQAVALAGQKWTIKPRIMDVFPNDGILDAGTTLNPYTIQDSYGRTRATIKPRIMDVFPNDGILDAGTTLNPYEVNWGDRY